MQKKNLTLTAELFHYLGPWLVFTRGGKLIKHYQAPSELVNQHLWWSFANFFFFFHIVVNDLFHL